jgi:HEAT repeat protein
MIRNRTALTAMALVGGLASSCLLAQQPLPAEGDEEQLIGLLESEAELFEKAKACQRLAVIGTSKSVSVLANLLNDARLSHYARFGLESNPSPEVDTAFRKALGELKGALLVGVINSIGVRRDTAAVAELQQAVDSSDVEVATAALAALGAIAAPESLDVIKQALEGSILLRGAAADACLNAADTLLIEGKNAEAADLLSAVRNSDLPKHLNVASRFGEIRADSGGIHQLMNQYLANPDGDLFRIGLELAHDLTDAETTRQLLKHLDSASSQRQVLLLHVLGNRGDSSALPAVLEAAGSSDVEISSAAVAVLGTLGDRSVVPVLLKAGTSGNEELAAAARESLVGLSGTDVDADLSQRLAQSTGRQRLLLVETAGRRGISSTIPLLMQYVGDEDEQLRDAAIEALGLTVGLDNFPSLVDQLIAADASETAGPLKEALSKAAQRMPDRDAAAGVLLERMARASTGAVADLADLLILVGGGKALAGLDAAAKSSDDVAADAATQALGRWLTPDVGPVLLELAKNGNEKYRIRCLRGYIRVIRQFGLKPNQRLQMSKQAFATATRDEERKLVLDTLTRFPSPAALRMVTPHLTNAALRDEACQAAVTICEKIVTTNPAAVAAAMPQVIAVSEDQALTNRAKVLVDRVGNE